MEKISGIYKITNNITGEFYIGSSKDIKDRWNAHKRPSTWKRCTGMKIYKDMVQYGLNKFKFEIIEETSNLKEREQYWIDLLRPLYNTNRANGWNTERYKEKHKATDKDWNEAHPDYKKEYQKEYHKAHRDEILAKSKEWQKTHREKRRSYSKEYKSRLCFYNNETLTFGALSQRFIKQGIPHPTQEARKYLIEA